VYGSFKEDIIFKLGSSFFFLIAVKALKEIGNKIGKKDWDFGVDPCSGKGKWNVSDSRKGFESSVICDCSFNHNSSCHVVSMYVLDSLLSHLLSVSFFLDSLKQKHVAENHVQSCVVRLRKMFFYTSVV